MKAGFSVSYLCQKLDVSTSGFYEWVDREPSLTKSRNDELTAQVIVAFATSKGAAGYRKVTAALARKGIPVDRKTVAVIMRNLGLISPAAEHAFKTANRRKARAADPADLLLREFASLTPGAIMVGDITYVPTQQGWLYVATVIDLASRAVLGYATGTRMTTQLIIRAMNMAIDTGHVKPGAVFHSDHGVQYRSKKFTDTAANTASCARWGRRCSAGTTPPPRRSSPSSRVSDSTGSRSRPGEQLAPK